MKVNLNSENNNGNNKKNDANTNKNKNKNDNSSHSNETQCQQHVLNDHSFDSLFKDTISFKMSCHHCSEQFNKYENYCIHLRSHYNDKTWLICQICGESTPTVSDFISHIARDKICYPFNVVSTETYYCKHRWVLKQPHV